MRTFMMTAVFMAFSYITVAQTTPSVTITATGNRNKQIVVDGTNYSINNLSVTDEQTVTINDLAIGQHSLELVRSNQYNSKRSTTKSYFNVRDGYDLTITVNANGAISSTEKKITNGNNGTAKAMTTATYNKLTTQVKAKPAAAARASILETEFTTGTRTLTAKQASQLIQLVNSESLRLKLAKQSYARISDQGNFSLVSNLLSSSSNRTDLSNYIASLANEGDNEDVADNNDNLPLTTEKFTSIYNEVKGEPTVNDRVYYLNNFFSRDYNFYSADQAKQLIELVSTESERLTMAKNAYRGVTDRENYGTVYQLLTVPANRSALVTYINSYDNSNPRAAMTSTAFDNLYKSIYNQYSSSARYNSINTAFTTSGNYFTAQQAKKLIPLVSDDASRLQLSKNVYKVLVDRNNYTQLNEFLSASSRTNFNSYVANYDNLYVGNGMAMSETDYNALYKSVNSAWSASTRFNLEADAFRNSSNYFTTYQVRQLLSLISSENDKLTLAKNAYDNTVDPNNFSQLYDLFANTNNRNDLTSFVSNVQNGTTSTVKIPMSETEFNAVYRNVQLTFGIGAKYSTLVTVFNTETNYFTVAQAKQLIQMVSSESNRLELAKSSYNNITDPGNFSQLYDIFSSQASKNELMNYVSSNAYNN